MNICIIGNTHITKELITYLVEKKFKVKIIFGLNKKNIKKKSNTVDIRKISQKYKIKLICNESWVTLSKYLKLNKIELIFSFGNSLIIPKNIYKKFNIICNHGAELPYVRGGASLSWGRMMNLGYWYTSLFIISDKIDDGPLISKKKFKYDKDISMKKFYKIAIKNTIDQIDKLDLKNLSYNQNNNLKKVTSYKLDSMNDTYKIVKAAKKKYLNKEIFYLPRRSYVDSKICNLWPNKFISIFKIANNTPFPKFYY